MIDTIYIREVFEFCKAFLTKNLLILMISFSYYKYDNPDYLQSSLYSRSQL